MDHLDDDDSTSSDEDDNRIENGIMDHRDGDNVEDGLSEPSPPSSVASSDEASDDGGRNANNSNNTNSQSRGRVSSFSRSYPRRQISYDQRLPTQHAYLGTDLTELSGRVVLDDDSLITLPLLSLPGVILVPGQTLPMQLQHQMLISMVRRIIDKDRTFGLTSMSATKETRLGTTAEIRSYALEDEDDEPILRMKAEGRQVFVIQETWRGLDGILMGRVKILSEANVTHPFRSNCLNSARGSRLNQRLLPASTPVPHFVYQQYEPMLLMERIMTHLEHWSSFDRTEIASNSSGRASSSMSSAISPGPNTGGGGGGGGNSEGGSSSITSSIRKVITATFRLNEEDGMHDLDEENEDEEEELEFESENAPSPDQLQQSLGITDDRHRVPAVPTTPPEFSYWVAGNLPLDDHHLLEFLTLVCPIQRLRWLLSILQKYLYICCARCKTKICKKDDVFSMSIQGPQGTYVNPAGYVHETITVYRAESLILHDRPSTEFSWFPGYAWSICSCSHCHHHIGWKFIATKDKSLKPEFFWGLTRSSIELGFKSDPEKTKFRPVI